MRIARFSSLSFMFFVCLALFATACGDESDGDEVLILTPTESGQGNDDDAAPSNELNGERGSDTQNDGPALPGEENNPETEVDPASMEPAGQDDRGPAELFGARLSDDVQFVPFEELLEDPEAYADRLIQTEGMVRQVCQRRGCWMEIRSADNPSSENMNIRFLDYGFFVPLDSRGAFVRVQGTAAVTVLTAAEVQELLAEGYDPGVVREDGTAILIRFTASGVMMWNRADN